VGVIERQVWQLLAAGAAADFGGGLVEGTVQARNMVSDLTCDDGEWS
jgi:hypothetical protein